jgi:hypothetical protein
MENSVQNTAISVARGGTFVLSPSIGVQPLQISQLSILYSTQVCAITIMPTNFYSGPHIAVQHQEQEHIGYEQNRYSRAPPRYSPITQPLPRKPVPVETIVPTGEPPLISSWGVGWKTPAEIICYYCLGRFSPSGR